MAVTFQYKYDSYASILMHMQVDCFAVLWDNVLSVKKKARPIPIYTHFDNF